MSDPSDATPHADRFRLLFDEAQIPLFEQDGTVFRRELDRLTASGVGDLSAYFKTTPERFVDLLRDTPIVAANKEFVRLFELDTPGRFREMTVEERFEHAIPALIDHVCELYRTTGRTSSCETDLRVTLPSGRTIDVCGRSTVLPGSEVTWERILVSFDDRTPRVETEVARRTREEIFRAGFEAAPIGIFQVSLEGTILSANPCACAILGYAREELMGMNWRDLTFADDLDASNEVARRLISGEADSVSLDKRYRRKDGFPITVEISVGTLRGDDGSPRYFVTVFNDVSAQRSATKALTESEARYRVLYDNAEDVISIIDLSGRIIATNPFTCRLLGYTREEMERMTISDIDAEPDKVADRIDRLRSDGQVEFEPVLRKKNGERVFLSVKARLIEWDGQPVIFNLGRDIGERLLAERDLQVSREQIRALATHTQETVETERKRIAREVHDVLGQGLMAMKMDVAAVAAGLRKDQKALSKAVSDVLGYIDGFVMTVQRITADLRPVLLDDLGLGAALEWLGGDFGRRSGLPCRVTVEPVDFVLLPPSLSTALYRIVQEALTNVSRHSDARNVWIDLTVDDTEVRLDVSDDGVGIPSAALSDPRSFGFAGMRERLLPFDGSVSFLARPGGGTIVRVSVPR